jgi:hypothetical protein
MARPPNVFGSSADGSPDRHGRIVDQHHQRLAGDVDALVVVPAVLRRLDAVADEHQLRRVDRDLVGHPLGPATTSSRQASVAGTGDPVPPVIVSGAAAGVMPTSGTFCT